MRFFCFSIFSFLLLTQIHAISVSAMNIQHSACGAPTGAIDVSVWGGLGPYSFLWSNGATTPSLSGLLPGTYEVTVTDANSDQAFGSWIIQSGNLSSPGSAQDGHVSCVGSSGGQVRVIEYGINGVPPYSYVPSSSGIDSHGHPYFIFSGTPPGSDVQIQVTDANGCTGTLTQRIIAPQLIGGPNMQVSNVQGSCSNGAGGAATISNINDGSYPFGQPQYTLLNALGQPVANGFSAPNTITFTALAPGNFHFVRDWDPSGTYMAYSCWNNPFDRIDFAIPDLGPDCGSVSGSVYIDNNQNCVQNGGEVGVPYQVLVIQPGSSYAITDGDGHYAFDVVDGSYTLGQTDPTLVQLCPANAPVPFSIASNQSVINLADSSTVPLDLAVQLQAGSMRPGFSGTFWGRVRNLSPQLSGPVTLTFTLDGDLVYVGASPAPTTINGNMLTWDLAAFTALQSVDVEVNVNVPVATPLGTPLSSSLSAANPLAESTLANNTASVNDQTVGSFDPNVKTARTSSGFSDALYFIDVDEWVDYAIQFQNTGTASAVNVVVTDTLSNALDMATFQQGVASHPFSVAFKPDRVVEWTFANIQLPDSGTNEVASHGLVAFRIRPRMPLMPGTLIENTANIYFDFNDPVITEPSVLVAEFSTEITEPGVASITITPNPADDRIAIHSSEPLGQVELWGTDGRLLLTKAMNGTDMQIPVGTFAPGMYVMRSVTATGEVLRERFIKQ
ncbi:MAG: T9SS type A sorting domain-containing protein [Flavobacteriales bacterium]|nr:T9SS type A sorting domain-containing protein [Flavobacteriales bacterium]